MQCLAAHLRASRLLLAACLVVGATPARASQDATLRALVDEALSQNRDLVATEAQVTSLEHEITRAGAWQHPKVQLALQNAPIETFALDEQPMTMLLVRLEQTVPFAGKTARRARVAAGAAEAKRWSLAEARNALAASVTVAYYQLALARQLKTLTGEHIALVQKLVDAVRTKYEVGRAAQQDLLRLEVLSGRLEDELEDFDRRDRELTATINAALHRPVASPIDTPDALVLQPLTADQNTMLALAKAHRPRLKELGATATMHRARADLATYEAAPDLTLFAAYGLRRETQMGGEGRDLVSVGVGFPLPLFYGSQHEARSLGAIALAQSADARRDASLDAIAGTIAAARANHERAVSKVRTYEKVLIPRAQRTLDATLTSYKVDRADFASLYEAELDLLNFEKTIHAATAAGLTARAIIEKAIGRSLP